MDSIDNPELVHSLARRLLTGLKENLQLTVAKFDVLLFYLHKSREEIMRTTSNLLSPMEKMLSKLTQKHFSMFSIYHGSVTCLYKMLRSWKNLAYKIKPALGPFWLNSSWVDGVINRCSDKEGALRKKVNALAEIHQSEKCSKITAVHNTIAPLFEIDPIGK